MSTAKHTPQQFEHDGFNSPREVELAQASTAKHTPRELLRLHELNAELLEALSNLLRSAITDETDFRSSVERRVDARRQAAIAISKAVQS